MDFLTNEDKEAIERHKREIEMEMGTGTVIYNLEDLMLERKVIADIPPYPSGFYPKPINDLCKYYQEALNIPSDFIKNHMLAVISHGIGTKSIMKIKEEWYEPAIVWTCNIAYASGKKSPSLHQATKPVEALEEEDDQKFKMLMEEYEDELERYQVELDSWRSKKNRKVEDKPIEPQPPVRKDYITKDVTIEALIELLGHNDILNIQDEFAGWIAGMDMYKGGKGNERQKWLTLWSGKSEKVIRKSVRFKTRNRTSVNITGTIQPDKLAQAIKQDNDGFVERILFSFPIPIEREWVDTEVPQSLVAYYHDLVMNLHTCMDSYKEEPFIVTFSEEAYRTFAMLMQEEIYRVMNDPSIDEAMKSLYGKFEGYFGRFCLIKYWLDVISGLEDHTGQISMAQVYSAWQLVKYYIAHSQKAHMMINEDEGEKKLQKILLKIKDGFKGFITPRELVQSIKYIKNTSEAYEWIEKIENLGYGYKDTEGRKKGVRLYSDEV